MRTIEVKLKYHQYPVVIGQNVLYKLGEHLQQLGVSTAQKLFLITDTNVAPLYADRLMESLRKDGFEVGQAIVPAGEKSKNLKQVEDLIGQCISFGLDRQSVILALGGGVVGDLAGFVAASFMRGIPFVQLPTTLLAHDSSIGGKVGVNHPLGKNYIGAFHQPLLVLFDVTCLHTLPQKEMISGFAEVIKHAFLSGEAFVDWLVRHRDQLVKRESDALVEAIYRGCQVKVNIITQDERESSLRAALNYGHTIGHALEAISDYQTYTHGEAISVGMAGAARLSVRLGKADPTLISQTEELLQAFSLPVRYEEDWSIRELLTIMRRDKKVKQGKYTFVLLRNWGQIEFVQGSFEQELMAVLEELKNRKNE